MVALYIVALLTHIYQRNHHFLYPTSKFKKIVNFKKVNRDPEKLPEQDEDRV